ncbi:holo-[acyl-carrier protein] synthase [Cytobacillus horneckiae]|uniref:Holo-[acyl-carrier-protein] synthase n=1 Tax=Cytobacillus horneckiae TaxID=549687 RepID=A0A2N0ZJR0_9BACI|nr:holo-ACP synthase [Cytobacillus horneckiae]MBN6888585.1 holo-ACP synthase [Cytobacillus horneckiae]MCM3180490.1 holo-ACP synthase [Cytobacillus horneckiae]MEC1158865.1 holo-ACP synthase [Cytobacillus horneckiae]MED2938714.1 holo-ACP synthase [Cytobacillus horneckiae]PKG29755.1 holo-ACP synthase [Cytobacillus horneckiae]
MIIGIGIDITELSRIKTMAARQARFVDRILTANEKAVYEALSEKRKVEYLAGRFSAKEAFSKAYGTGIGKDLSFKDIETATHDSGKPIIVKPLKDGVHLSISHSKEYAVAQVVIEQVN